MLISDWNSDVCPSDLGQEPKYCIVNVSTCIVAKIQDNRFPAGFLFHHIEQETLQFATAHVFHAGIGNPVLAYGINMIALTFDPLFIKFRSEKLRVGKEGVSQCNTWWLSYLKKK